LSWAAVAGLGQARSPIRKPEINLMMALRIAASNTGRECLGRWLVAMHAASFLWGEKVIP
jgi:hypothetical protein